MSIQKSKALQDVPFLATSISSSVQRDVSTGSEEADRNKDTGHDSLLRHQSYIPCSTDLLTLRSVQVTWESCS